MPQLKGNGLTPVLDTDDYSCWEAAVSTTLGHHRSELLGHPHSFQACFRVTQIGACQMLHLQGRGRLRLIREQGQRRVLWLPLRGISQERINGREFLAEPGTALLFHPGDTMAGETSEELEGLSILLPEWPQLDAPDQRVRLLSQGPQQQRILRSARHLASAAALGQAGAEHAADALLQALWDWLTSLGDPPTRERITARRRRDLVKTAQRWMAARLEQRFSLEELSTALDMSPRQVQYSFRDELGRTPMEEAKRLRLHRLRDLLRNPREDQRSVAELMVACGLVASGVTSADYRRFWGENPSSTRRLRA